MMSTPVNDHHSSLSSGDFTDPNTEILPDQEEENTFTIEPVPGDDAVERMTDGGDMANDPYENTVIVQDDLVTGDDGDFSEVPIERGGEASLPAPEELRTSSSSNRNRCCDKTFWCILVTTLVICGVIIGISVGISTRNKNAAAAAANNPYQDNYGSTTGSGGGGSSPRNADLFDVIDWLSTEGISSRADLMLSNSMQRQAAEWIAELDYRNVFVPTGGAGTFEGYKFTARYVLALLWFSTQGPGWQVQTGFMKELDVCQWNTVMPYRLITGRVDFFRVGVYCNQQGVPVELHLDFNQLTGNIPDELAKLKTLLWVDFDGNKLRGGFSPKLCELTNLIYLGMAHNDLVSQLPDCLQDLTNLRVLLLSDNEFHNKIPDMSKLSHLEALFLDDNRLSGDVSTMFNTMTNLTYLYLDNNYFDLYLNGEFLKDATRLQRLDISGTSALGNFPGHLLSHENMTILDVHNNRLDGKLPELMATNTNLQLLAMQDNELSGDIPASIQNLRGLLHLDMAGNQFDGTMTPEIGNLKTLTYLFLADNPFTQGSIPETFSQLTAMEELSLKSTGRSGVIPGFFGSNMRKLVLLDLDDNQLQGPLPPELGSLEDLQFLFVNRNKNLTGAIPSSLSQLRSLRAGFFDNTDLSGDFDGILCSLPMFNNSLHASFGDEMISADCAATPSTETFSGNDTDLDSTAGGTIAPRVTCKCCKICCQQDELDCNDNDMVASLKPQWELVFDRFEYEFSSKNGSTAFRDISFIPFPNNNGGGSSGGGGGGDGGSSGGDGDDTGSGGTDADGDGAGDAGTSSTGGGGDDPSEQYDNDDV